MKTLSKIGANTLWQIGSKGVNAITGLLLIGIIQRTLGETGVGVYTIIISYVSFFFMPVDFGLNAVAVKEILDSKENTQKVVKNILAFRIILSLVLITVGILVAYSLPYNRETGIGFSPEINIGIVAASFAILAQALLSTTNGYFQATQNYKFSFLANGVSALTNVAMFILLLNKGLPIHYAISALAISGMAGGVTALLFVRKNIKRIKPEINKKYLKKILVESAPLTISLLLNLIYFRIDSLILPFYRSIEEVGKYNIAYKIFDTILVIPNYFANALFPNLIERLQISRLEFIKIVKKSTILLTLTALCCTIAGYLGAPLAVEVITGSNSPETVTYIRILTAGLVFFFLSSSMMWSLVAINKQKYLAYIYGSTMAINIALNYLLIPVYGATASAIITITTELLVLMASTAVVFKELRSKE